MKTLLLNLITITLIGLTTVSAQNIAIAGKLLIKHTESLGKGTSTPIPPTILKGSQIFYVYVVSNKKIEIQDLQNPYTTITTDSKGYYKITLPVGCYKVVSKKWATREYKQGYSEDAVIWEIKATTPNRLKQSHVLKTYMIGI